MRGIARLKIKEALKIMLVCLMTLAIPVLLVLYGLQEKRYSDLVKEVVELESKQEKLIEENKKLVGDISLLSSAERIEKIATDELGMHKAEAEDIIRVEMTGEKK